MRKGIVAVLACGFWWGTAGVSVAATPPAGDVAPDPKTINYRPLLSQPRRGSRDREPPEALPKRGKHCRRPQPFAGASVSVAGPP